MDERCSTLVVCWILLEVTTVPGEDDRYTMLVVCWTMLVVRPEFADEQG